MLRFSALISLKASFTESSFSRFNLIGKILFLNLFLSSLILFRKFLSTFLEHAITSAPFCEKISSIFSPIPLLEPVITAVLSLSNTLDKIFFCKYVFGKSRFKNCLTTFCHKIFNERFIFTS